MGITANISLNTAAIILTVPPKYQLTFNVNAESTHPIISSQQYVDGALHGTLYTIPTPSTSYSNMTTPFYVNGTGWHFVEIEFFNNNGESIRVGQQIYLDLTNPILNNFSLNRVERNAANDYVVYFDIDISDDSGISRTRIDNITDGTSAEVFIPLSFSDYRAEQSIIVPGTNNNVVKQFTLEYEDYSGNKISTVTPIDVFFTNTPPNINTFDIVEITQTATDYIIKAKIVCSFASYQNISGYSITYEDPAPVWRSTFITGSTATIIDTVIVPKTEAAGTKKLYASVVDNYNNESTVSILSFGLDKLKPFGAVNLDFAEKIGANYYANIHFTATDAGKVAAYSYNTLSPSINYWNLITPPTQTFDTYKTLNMGPNGQKILYVQYRDFSGNLSDVYTLPIDIDVVNPDCSFDFDHGELRTDGDYNAFFNLIAADDTSIDFIKLYGVNSNTGNIVTGHSNTWVRIPHSVRSYNEIRPIIIPSVENEDNLEFYYQVRDLFGNESPVRTLNVQFDKTPPVLNTLEYHDVVKSPTSYKIYADFNATDDKGIVAYRYGFDDITVQNWVYVTKTMNLDETIYLEVPITDVGIAKSFDVQVKDLFGNYSNVLSLPIEVDTQAPIGSLTFAGGGLTPTDFTLDFQIDGSDPNNDVYWYSLEIDDPTLINWKKLDTPGLVVSEIKQLLLPRTSTGRHNFYLRFADIYKNISPVYNLEYDLDSLNTVGGLNLVDIEKTVSTYNANVELYAFDNRKIKSYFFNGGPETLIVPPVQNFSEHVISPIGLSAGPRTFTVRYKDTFDNLSDVYTLNFNLDNTDPFGNVYFTGATSDANNFYLNFDLNMTDNQELYEYKFWYLSNPEPSTWSSLPRGQTSFTINETFTIPNTNLFPGFRWKVRDFFENEYENDLYKTITTVPPTINSLTVSNTIYGLGGSNVEVSYDITADTGSTVNKLEVIVNEVGLISLDTFEVDVNPNASHAVGTFYYTFPLNIKNCTFKVRAFSDYNYASNYLTIAHSIDNIRPNITNADYIGSFSDNSDYILQFRIQGNDADSGIRRIRASVTTAPVPTSTTYTVDLTNTLDEVVNVRVDGSHISNLVDVTFTLYDLLGNQSFANTVSGVFLDRDAPMISNVHFNYDTTYDSPIVGTNSSTTDVSFDSSDFSTITHYKYSPNITETYNASWNSVPVPSENISVLDTINMDALGFIEGNRHFYIHVMDRFGNISTAGLNIEYDKTPPVFSTTFLDRIERIDIAGVDNFAIPYTLSYNDNYSEVKYTYKNYEIINGNTYPVTRYNLPTLENANTFTDYFYLPVAYYGQTGINVSFEDRFLNRTANSSFNVFLENNAPVINYTLINNGAKYTRSKDVYIRMDMTDDRGVTESLFSNSANETWNSNGWTPIPYAPTTAITTSFSVDLEAIGFDQGVCNVYCYIKDFCQNVANTAQTIIYDYEPPVVVDFTVNSIIRSVDTFDVTLNAFAYDVTSGLDTYYISNSNSNKVYDPVPGAPIIGTTPILFSEVEKVSVKDSGWKTFYFQATDAAGNISVKANTKIYIDGMAPVATFFQPTSTISKYYLNAANNEFEYIVTDDYALESLEYQIDNLTITPFKSFDPSNNIVYDANTFLADFTPLVDGEHTIYLTVLDSFQNRVRVPYEFYFDNTAPAIANFSIKEIRPYSGLTYDVEFNINAYDEIGIDYYELYDNDVFVARVPIDAKSFKVSPTIKTTLTDIFDSNLNIYLMLVEDSLGITYSNAYVLVQNYTGTISEENQIKAFLKNIIGIPDSEIMMFTSIGNDVDVIKQNGSSLTNEIPALDLTQFPSNYEILQFYTASGSNIVPVSNIATYIKNNYIYTAIDPAVNNLIEYNAVWLSGEFSDVSVHKELHNYEVRIYDYAGNMTSSIIPKFIHDGTNLHINSFTVDSTTSISRNTITSELFEANVSSDVDVIEYALTIHPTIDFYSGFWNDFAVPSDNIDYSDTVDLQNFAISELSSNGVYFHAKDDCGNVANSSVEIIFSSNHPIVKSVNSPIILKRQGNYYIGELVFEIKDPDNQIEAYAIGFSPEPTNYKSLSLMTSGIITQQFKIPENQIDGSQIVYLKLRDTTGNQSLTYRISTRVLDFEFDKFEVIPDPYMVVNGNVRVLYDTDSNPNQMVYGYRIDDNNEPTVWNNIMMLNQNSIGEYYFDFNIDVTSINVGKHEIFVWLKSLEEEKVSKSASFISEQNPVSPFVFLSISKTKYDQGKKKVWVEANIFDNGVGVEQICFDEDTNPDIFDNINIIQNKRILKLFEYDATDNSQVTYKVKLIDAVGTLSLTYNVTVDLANVF